jgi:Protein of unknown function (DUF2798)
MNQPIDSHRPITGDSRKLPPWTRPFITGLFLSVSMTSTLTYKNLATSYGWTGISIQKWLTAIAGLLPYSFPVATVVHPIVRKLVNHLVEPTKSTR